MNSRFLLALSLASILISCQKDEAPTPLEPRPVVTFQVPDPTTETTRRFSGETAAANSVELGFQVAGRIQEIIAITGGQYRKGDVLARLDPSLLQADLQNARAQSLQATQELRRTQELLESGNASKASFDAAIATQKATESSLESARLAVSYATLTMPYDGFVSEVPTDTNQVVSVGTPVVHIQSEVGMNFEVGVPTAVVGRITNGQMANLSLSAFPNKTIEAKVIKISPLAQSNTTYPVTLAIEDAESIAGLRADMDGEAIFNFALPESSSDRVSIPASAVVADPEGFEFVWTLVTPEEATSRIEKTKVTIGNPTADGQIEILDGLTSGLTIIAKGAQTLTPEVTVALPDLPTASEGS